MQLSCAAEPQNVLHPQGIFYAQFYTNLHNCNALECRFITLKLFFMLKQLTTNIPGAIILNNRISTDILTLEPVKMNATFAMIGILGLLAGIILVRLIMCNDSAKSYVLQCQAF